MEYSSKPMFSPAAAPLVRLIDRALMEGVIREDRLRFHLTQLKADPEVAGRLYKYLKAHDVRMIPCVEEPVYDPQQRLTLPLLVEQQGQLLSERERLILRLRFIEGKDLTQTAEQLQLSRERVRQIESRAVRRLTHRPQKRSKKIQDFYE